MKAKRFLAVLLMVAMLCTVALTACNKTNTPANNTQQQTQGTTAAGSAAQTETKEDYYLGKYDPPLVINVPYMDNNRVAPTGMDPKNDNMWTRAYRDELGVVFNHVWEVSNQDYTTKLNMVIATDDLPDIFQCDFNTYSRLASAGKLADLTDLYPKHLLPELYDVVTNQDPEYMKVYAVKGRIYGVFNPAVPAREFLHYRNDWAKAVGITEKPKTLDDVINMAYAFAKGNPNGNGSKVYGLGVNKGLFGSPGLVSPIFAAVDAWPNIWIEENGELIFGALTEQNKEALQILQKMFKDGIIDSEFGLKGAWAELTEDVAADKIGMLFCPQYVTDWGAIRTVSQNHPWEATWTSVIMPHKNGGYALGMSNARSGSNGYVVRKGFSNPEVLLKMNNFTHKKLTDKETAQIEFHTVIEGEEKIATFFLNFIDGAKIQPSLDPNLDYALEVTDAINGKLDPAKLSPQAKLYYDESMKYVNKTDFSGYNYYHIFYMFDGGTKPLEFEVINKRIYKNNAFYGANTDTMNKNFGNLTEKRNELFTKMIMGADIESTFKEWVDYFNSQGGIEITKEVNEWYKNR